MKDFFSVDIHTGFSESSSAIARTLSKELEAKQEEYTKKMDEFENKAKFPTVYSTIRVVAIILSLFLVGTFCMHLTTMQDGEKIGVVYWLTFAFGLIFLIVSSLLSNLKKRFVKKVVESEEYREFLKEWDSLFLKCEQDLKIAKNAKLIDVFLYVYTTKSGKEKPAQKSIKYLNASAKIFNEDGKIMIADQQTVFALEKKWFKDYETIKERTTFNRWHKEKPFTENPYRKFGVKVNGYGVYSVKNCLKAIMEKDGKQYCMIIPPYDAETFMSFVKNAKGGKNIKK